MATFMAVPSLCALLSARSAMQDSDGIISDAKPKQIAADLGDTKEAITKPKDRNTPPSLDV